MYRARIKPSKDRIKTFNVTEDILCFVKPRYTILRTCLSLVYMGEGALN